MKNRKESKNQMQFFSILSTQLKADGSRCFRHRDPRRLDGGGGGGGGVGDVVLKCVP